MTYKTAFITGAGSGIGRALAHRLADLGVAVFITDINEENLKTVEAELKKKQVNVHARKTDVSDKDDVFSAANEADKALGGIDIVFNNAGISLSDTVEKMEYSDFERVMDVDFWGVVHGTKAFLPAMLKRGNGYIVNVSSIFGHIGVPTQAAYCAAKHAVKGFNESLHYELKDTGVSVHSVHPGGVDTGIVTNGKHINTMSGSNDLEEMQASFKKSAITTPERAAEIILAGVDKGKYRILVGKDAVWIDRLSRWMPNRWLVKFAKRLEDGSALT
ncbi:MAG: acetoin dehydrogenase [Kordiimonadales bacterium]|nr:MAG: acetoin dehydrogenase [Kordiimonadales bacterium]